MLRLTEVFKNYFCETLSSEDFKILIFFFTISCKVLKSQSSLEVAEDSFEIHLQI